MFSGDGAILAQIDADLAQMNRVARGIDRVVVEGAGGTNSAQNLLPEYVYRTIRAVKKGLPAADPNAIHFPDVGSIGTVKPRGSISGSKNTLEGHVNGNFTDSDFVSWSTSVEANWKLFGPTRPAHDGMFMQLRVKLAELKNTIYDS